MPSMRKAKSMNFVRRCRSKCLCKCLLAGSGVFKGLGVITSRAAYQHVISVGNAIGFREKPA